MTFALWHCLITATVQENKIPKDNLYWRTIAGHLSDDLINDYLEGNLSIPGGKYRQDPNIVKAFEEEIVERILLK